MRPELKGRQFQFWAYRVSHGELLVRSPAEGEAGTNLDLHFLDVRYVELPRHLDEIEIVDADDAAVARASERVGSAVSRDSVFVIRSRGQDFLVVAHAVHVQENALDVVETPFELPGSWVGFEGMTTDEVVRALRENGSATAIACADEFAAGRTRAIFPPLGHLTARQAAMSDLYLEQRMREGSVVFEGLDALARAAAARPPEEQLAMAAFTAPHALYRVYLDVRRAVIGCVRVASRAADEDPVASRELPRVRRPQLNEVVDVLVRFADRHGTRRVSPSTIKSFLDALLFGERALWQSHMHGLVLEQEVIDACLDRYRTAVFGTESDDVTRPQWVALQAELASVLFRHDGD